MSVKFFGQFLIECGEIDSAQLREALDLMEGENQTIGEIAVREGFLSQRDADRVNVQQRIVDRPFGELAVDMGLISSTQLEQCLRRQQEARLPIGESLVRLGHLADDRLGVLLDEFKVSQAPFVTQSVELTGQLSESRLAPCVIDFLPRLCLRMARLRVKVAPAQPLEEPIALPFRVSIAVHGAENLWITLAGDRDFAARIAAGASGFDAYTIEDEFIADGMGEFLNVLAGNALSVLERAGIVANLSSPRCDAEATSGTRFELVATEGSAVLVLSAG